jgi:Tol biopolymer transport system component
MQRQISAIWILGALTIVLAGLWIAGPVAGGGLAQAAPTRQATVDAAVETLFAQTAQAPGVMMTEAVATAFSAAQTATAAAAPVAAPPVAPLTADTLQVADVIELPLLAAPGGTSAYLSPDATRIAYWASRVMCILDIETVNADVKTAVAAGTPFENALDGLATDPGQFPGVACVSLEKIGGIDEEGIRWSPDGRYLVMTENFFKFLRDPDLWVLDTQTMTLADITDDGDLQFSLTQSDGIQPLIDVVPRWMADGRLIFLRYIGKGMNFNPPYVYTIQPDGSDLQQVGQLQTTGNFSVFALAVSADGQLAYNRSSTDVESLSGVWISDLDGSNPRQLWHNADQPRQVPPAVDWSPDGQYVAFVNPIAFEYASKIAPENSVWNAVRVSDGQLLLFSSDQFVRSAGWSPDGRAIVYTNRDLLDDTLDGVYISAGPGEPGRMLMPASADPSQRTMGLMSTTSLQEQMIPWTANNTVMVGRGGQPGILILRLAAP